MIVGGRFSDTSLGHFGDPDSRLGGYRQFVISQLIKHVWEPRVRRHIFLSSYNKAVSAVHVVLFMSFCRILPTLWSQAAFHNIPQFFRGRQKTGIKSTV
jgi:hypothetical protein